MFLRELTQIDANGGGSAVIDTPLQKTARSEHTRVSPRPAFPNIAGMSCLRPKRQKSRHLSGLGSREKNLAQPKVAQRPSERARASQIAPNQRLSRKKIFFQVAMMALREDREPVQSKSKTFKGNQRESKPIKGLLEKNVFMKCEMSTDLKFARPDASGLRDVPQVQDIVGGEFGGRVPGVAQQSQGNPGLTDATPIGVGQFAPAASRWSRFGRVRARRRKSRVTD